MKENEVALMIEERKLYKVLVGNAEGKRPRTETCGRPGQDNNLVSLETDVIYKRVQYLFSGYGWKLILYLKKIMFLSHGLARSVIRPWAVVNTVMNLRLLAPRD
jgi:hypothetical protein